jgi:hypothetical protein
MERREERDGAITRARWQLQALVLELAREAFGDSAVERRARYDGDQFSEHAPTPLAGAWAAHQLWRCARGEMVSQVRRAREAGHSWEEIGRTLAFKPDADRTVAEATFEQMTGSAAPWSPHCPSFVWRCAACVRVISDRGPYERHPADNESGHSEDCVRLAGEVERWRASCDEEGAEDLPLPAARPERRSAS